MSSKITPEAPAPWHLVGEGFILNYWVNAHNAKAWSEFGILPTQLGKMLQVILVQYHDSNVGPYDELLILDHHLSWKGQRSFIPHIFVSTEASVINGQNNWGIPKQFANFEWIRSTEKLYVQVNSTLGELSLEIPLHTNTVTIPINTQHLPPALFKLEQRWQGQSFKFSPIASGEATSLKPARWKIKGNIFPDFSQARALGSFHIHQFNMTFPKAQISPEVK